MTETAAKCEKVKSSSDKDDKSVACVGKIVWTVEVSEEMYEQSKYNQLRTWQGKGEIVR